MYIPELVKAKDKKLKMFEILAKQESNMRLPNDIELSRYLGTMNFANFGHNRFILALVEEKLTKSRPDLSDTLLQLEHIMPQTLTEAWCNDLGDNHEEVHQELLNTIGNLTLIRHNQELGNKPFDEKRKIYSNNAGLQIAKTKITNHKIWNKEAIKERSEWIIDFLLKEVMPIPEKMRRINNFKPKEGRALSFMELQLIGLDIQYIAEPDIVAHVVSDKEVEFEGKKWRLSPLTKEIETRRGKVRPSGSYNGAYHWEFDGIRLADIL